MKGLSLARLPLVLGAIIGAALLISVALLFVLSNGALGDERTARHQLKAQQLAQQVSATVAFHRLNLVQFAQMEAVVGAALAQDRVRTGDLMTQLERHIPSVWKMRLVPARLQETDSGLRPPIGYADLELINQSLSEAVAPAAVADEAGTPQARVVLVQPILADQADTKGKVVGHLLLAVRFGLVAELVKNVSVDSGFMQLQQARKSGDPQVLSANGDNGLADQAAYMSPVEGTRWQVAYWPASGGGSLVIVFASVGLVVLLIAGGALFLLSAQLKGSITADLATLVVMVRDAKSGDLKPDYPSQATDVFGTIHTLQDELSSLGSGQVKQKPLPRVVDDTPDIDLDLDLD
ncbi:MAG: hypothetical protein JKY89_13550 [Immundisolibacteraceae bacterium]|nr:hypothetical protein [Immundisolibacteraceae bacterium]